ncbi:MAG: hypothetical protein P8X98_13210 [Woeseiaceae bacterium]
MNPSLPTVVDVHQEVDFFRNRNFEGIFPYRCAPLDVTDTLDGRELHGTCLELGIRFGDGDGLARRCGNAVRRHVGCGREPPGPVGNHAHADADRLGIDDVVDARLLRRDELVQVAADACVGVARSCFRCRLERDRAEPLLGGEVHAGIQQFFGRDRVPCERQHEAAHADTGQFHEFTSVHGVCLLFGTVGARHASRARVLQRSLPRIGVQQRQGQIERVTTIRVDIVDDDMR